MGTHCFASHSRTIMAANKSCTHARAYSHPYLSDKHTRPPNLTYATQSADRMKNSLFGQMKRNTSNWGDSAWRRSYVDIQDAGQEREAAAQPQPRAV